MIDPAVLQQLAPDGVLRAAINFGNPVLAQRGAGGEPQGGSVALAKALAEELGVELALITFEAAGQVFAALAEDAWRVAFLAIEPVPEPYGGTCSRCRVRQILCRTAEREWWGKTRSRGQRAER